MQGSHCHDKAVRVHKVGGPEALVYEDVVVAPPGPGRFASAQPLRPSPQLYRRLVFATGLYKAPGLPFIAGK